MNLLKKSWLHLSNTQKKYSILIFALMFIVMILECLSVGVVLPLISVLLRGEIGTNLFSYLFYFGQPTGKNLIYVGLAITLIIFLTKNLILTFNLWQQTKFLRNFEMELTNSLFKYYLKNDYIFFLQNNSAHL